MTMALSMLPALQPARDAATSAPDLVARYQAMPVELQEQFLDELYPTDADHESGNYLAAYSVAGGVGLQQKLLSDVRRGRVEYGTEIAIYARDGPLLMAAMDGTTRLDAWYNGDLPGHTAPLVLMVETGWCDGIRNLLARVAKAAGHLDISELEAHHGCAFSDALMAAIRGRDQQALATLLSLCSKPKIIWETLEQCRLDVIPVEALGTVLQTLESLAAGVDYAYKYLAAQARVELVTTPLDLVERLATALAYCCSSGGYRKIDKLSGRWMGRPGLSNVRALHLLFHKSDALTLAHLPGLLATARATPAATDFFPGAAQLLSYRKRSPLDCLVEETLGWDREVGGELVLEGCRIPTPPIDEMEEALMDQIDGPQTDQVDEAPIEG